jgi:hypothetical protein
MLDAARRAYVLTSGRERSDLDTDDTLALALARLLEIIGEAANTAPTSAASGASGSLAGHSGERCNRTVESVCGVSFPSQVTACCVW